MVVTSRQTWVFLFASDTLNVDFKRHNVSIGIDPAYAVVAFSVTLADYAEGTIC